MDLKRLKEQFRNLPGTLPVMVPDGNGGYVEATRVQVLELEMPNYNDGPAVVIDGGGDDG